MRSLHTTRRSFKMYVLLTVIQHRHLYTADSGNMEMFLLVLPCYKGSCILNISSLLFMQQCRNGGDLTFASFAVRRFFSRRFWQQNMMIIMHIKRCYHLSHIFRRILQMVMMMLMLVMLQLQLHFMKKLLARGGV